MSQADERFIATCKEILDHGVWQTGQVRPHWPDDGSPAPTKKRFAIVNRYQLDKEFPALTLRPVPLKNCLDEILWIWQKKSTRVSELRSHIWDAWALQDGTIGKAYGYQLAKKTQYPDGQYDQVERLRKDLKENPESRRLICTMYNPDDLPEMALYPCAYSLTLHIDQGVLNGILNQRSQDVLVANAWNVCQYALLLHMFAIDAGLKVGELVHVIADAHIYDRHIPIVEELIQRPVYPAPDLWIDPSVRSFDDFTIDSFRFEHYQHGEAIQHIPVAV